MIEVASILFIFQILASLFVLSVVAEPEGFDSVKAAKIQHLYAQPLPQKYYQPLVYGVQQEAEKRITREADCVKQCDDGYCGEDHCA